ncbi:MAG: flagellar M-ring protein FliF [Acidobacteria bacterium]|nr:flagellar M-ring protein FliF [Acidobacteriota bacterium]
MNQIKQLISRLTVRQRITIGAVAALVVGGLLYLAYWNKERDYKPLFKNLAAEDAGQVVARVKESGAVYKLADNGATVLVPSAKVAELRLQLAAAGLPKSGRIGYELFDKTNFGATDFTEQVNFHRALEGELERSVQALVEVEQARVHITFPKDSIYLENRQPAKASVMVKLKQGAKLSQQNVVAISHLAASAVEGLAPEGVSVLDMQGNLLSRLKKKGMPEGADPDDASIEYRQKVERDLLAKLNGTLEPLLGPEKYRAGISVECDFTSGEQSEENFDPAKSVMVTSQRSEDGSTGLVASGVPGAASSLPRPTSRPSSGTVGNNRRSESITYQSSRSVRHFKVPQGAIKRISVGIILDQGVRFDKGQRIFDPPSPEKLKVVKDVASGVVGAQPERGDQVVVETSPFEATLAIQPPPLPPAPPAVQGAPKGQQPQQQQKGPMTINLPSWVPAPIQNLIKKGDWRIMVGAGVAVLALLGAGVWFFLRRRKKAKIVAESFGEVAAGPDGKAIEGGPDPHKEFEAKIAEQNALKEQQTREALNSLKLPAVKTKKAEVLARHISEEAKRDPSIMAQVIRTWLSTSDYER